MAPFTPLAGRTTQAMEASKKKIEETGGQARVIAACPSSTRR
jgi:hypothetical protein